VCRADGILDAVRGTPSRHVLEESKHLPASDLKELILLLVASHIFGQLRRPIAAIRLWNLTMIWAAVPKASVDEDGQFQTGEDNIWPNAATTKSERQILTESEAASLQLRAKCDLGCGV